MNPTTRLPSGEAVPILGQGTWNMGEDSRKRKHEVTVLRRGLDLGMTLIDTAEMYADGGAEEVVGEAVMGRRDEVFLVTKCLPQNASTQRMKAACDRSLKRLRTDRVDLYLLHWPGSVPLQHTLDGFAALHHDGKIRHWGVSNFDLKDMEELVSLPGGSSVATNQVLYNLANRGIEWDLLPWCRDRGVPIMAYSPFGQARLLRHRQLKDVAARRGATPAQVALAWVLRQPGIIAIPKASQPEHLEENHRALEIRLTGADLHALNQPFPPPENHTPLEIL